MAKQLTNGIDLLGNCDTFIFDCDGVLWKGDSVINGVPSVIKQLRNEGKRVFFVTNNSTKSRKGHLQKFLDLGIHAEIEEIFSSGFAAAAYFEQHPMPPGKKAYVIGHQGLCDELELIGISCIGGPNDNDKKPEFNEGKSMQHDPEVGAVVVGFDANINYYKIQYAQLCLSENKDCRFIATNMDSVMHLTPDQEWSGAGTMVGAIKGCTGLEPVLVGKPSPLLVDYIAGKHGLDRARMCMVGDRLDTDIVFGQSNGLQTVLTLSGVTSEETLLNDANKTIPQYYVHSIKDFFPHIE